MTLRVVVIGAAGFVGTAVCARLAAEGYRVVGLARRPGRLCPACERIVDRDIGLLAVEDWTGILDGADAVVNCAGLLQDEGGARLATVHRDAPAILFAACARAGVRRIVQVSAIGVDRAQVSDFSATKLAGDAALMRSDLDWIVLRPSLILGRSVVGASALIRGLSALPLVPCLPIQATLQAVQLDDVAATVMRLVAPSAPSRLVLELAGPERFTMDELVARYREWHGWPPARRLALPGWAAPILFRLGDAAARLGWRPVLRGNAGRELARGAAGDPGPWTEATGIRPQSLDAALKASPASKQDRWFARLYWLKPALFVVLPAFWIATGLLSLTAGYEAGLAQMRAGGAGGLSGSMVVAGALADIAIGAAIAWRPSARRGLWGAIGLSLLYLAAGSLLRPDLWLDPLGPLVKIFPILALHAVALAMLGERR